MTTILNTFLAFITHHPGLAYGAVFLVSLSESLALVGLLVPGTVIMFGVGAVVATGRLGLFPVLLLAMAGAITGDGVSFWLGRHCKERLADIWPFSRYPGMLTKGAAFFHRHGGKKRPARAVRGAGASGHPGCGRHAGHAADPFCDR